MVNKSKTHVNPYFDVWAWSNQNLEWGGPEERTVDVKISHAILPILYHHFGCICPSYEVLSLIQQTARDRTILDIGSGNGYWTFMLRRFDNNPKKSMTVVPIDNGVSEWRTMWVDDTIKIDGAKWLQKHDGGREAVLLLVYPTVGNNFTSEMIKTYRTSSLLFSNSQMPNVDNIQMGLRLLRLVLKTRMGLRRLLRRLSPYGWPEKCLAGRRSFRYRCPALPGKTKLSLSSRTGWTTPLRPRLTLEC